MAYNELADQPVGPTLYLHGQKKRFFLPQGLEYLMDEMTRDVLKHNPKNLYEFLADFCDEKIRLRNVERASTRRHSWQWRKWSTDGSSVLDDEELRTFISQYKVPFEAAEHLATIIQSVYRGFQARKDYKELIEQKKRRKESLWEEWVTQGKFFAEGSDIQEILLHYGLTLARANECATKIQAMFRGHLTRKSIEAPNFENHLAELGISEEEAHRQATKIQQFYREHKARKLIKPKAEKLVEEHIEKSEEEEEVEEIEVKFLKKVSKAGLESEEEEEKEEDDEDEQDDYEYEGEFELPPDDADFLKMDEEESNKALKPSPSAMSKAKELYKSSNYTEFEGEDE